MQYRIKPEELYIVNCERERSRNSNIGQCFAKQAWFSISKLLIRPHYMAC